MCVLFPYGVYAQISYYLTTTATVALDDPQQFAEARRPGDWRRCLRQTTQGYQAANFAGKSGRRALLRLKN